MTDNWKEDIEAAVEIKKTQWALLSQKAELEKKVKELAPVIIHHLVNRVTEGPKEVDVDGCVVSLRKKKQPRPKKNASAFSDLWSVFLEEANVDKETRISNFDMSAFFGYIDKRKAAEKEKEEAAEEDPSVPYDAVVYTKPKAKRVRKTDREAMARTFAGDTDALPVQAMKPRDKELSLF